MPCQTFCEADHKQCPQNNERWLEKILPLAMYECEGLISIASPKWGADWFTILFGGNIVPPPLNRQLVAFYDWNMQRKTNLLQVKSSCKRRYREREKDRVKRQAGGSIKIIAFIKLISSHPSWTEDRGSSVRLASINFIPRTQCAQQCIWLWPGAIR